MSEQKTRKVSAVFTDDSGASMTVEIDVDLEANKMELVIRNTDKDQTITRALQESLAAGMATAFVEGLK